MDDIEHGIDHGVDRGEVTRSTPSDIAPSARPEAPRTLGTPSPEAPGSLGTPSPEAPHRWAAGHAIIAVVVALVLGSLFNAADLLATAERQEFGTTRTVSVAAAERLLAVSQFLRMDRPRRAIDQALGRTDPAVGPDAPALDDEVELEDAPEPGDETLAGNDPDTGQDADVDGPDGGAGQDTGAGAGEGPHGGEESEPGDGDGPVGAGSGDSGSGNGDEPADIDEPPTRDPITEGAPLTMYIGGDSMVGQFGMALEDLTDDTGVITTTEILYEFGSGLTRPDFIDWPEVMAEVSEDQNPEVVVLYFGGNDAQPLKLDGTVYEPEDPPWQDEYRSRVAELMAQLQDAGHTVYWMGMPIPRSETLQTRYIMLNDIYESEADAHDAVTYIPAWEHFTGPDGGFSEYLPNASGDVVDMRLDDGIHYTTAGAYRIARVAADRIIADHGITPAS